MHEDEIMSIARNLFEDDGVFIATLAITLGTLIALVAIVSGTIAKVVTSRGKERTKRELAAYVAEGTLEADKAVAMINAGRPIWEAGPKQT